MHLVTKSWRHCSWLPILIAGAAVLLHLGSVLFVIKHVDALLRLACALHAHRHVLCCCFSVRLVVDSVLVVEMMRSLLIVGPRVG